MEMKMMNEWIEYRVQEDEKKKDEWIGMEKNE